jgi:hypothetical protein
LPGPADPAVTPPPEGRRAEGQRDRCEPASCTATVRRRAACRRDGRPSPPPRRVSRECPCHAPHSRPARRSRSAGAGRGDPRRSANGARRAYAARRE